MTVRRERRAVQRLNKRFDPMVAGLFRQRALVRATWFKAPTPPPAPTLTAARVPEIPAVVSALDLQAGSYLWAKGAAEEAARRAIEAFSKDTEHWADALLVCPLSSLNYRTARFAGKPYHWRQRHYTGQLYLAAGESPW